MTCYINDVERGLYYAEIPQSSEYYMTGVNIVTNPGTVSGIDSGYGFSECSNLTNCKGTGKGYIASASRGYGFNECRAVIACKAGGKCTTAAFERCCASNSDTSTYACADTANGGFNNTTNPSV